MEHTVLQAGARFEATHIAGETTERCYDHILTTTNLFVVREVGYDHSVRQGENAVSDHSIVLATLSPGGEQFDDDLLP